MPSVIVWYFCVILLTCVAVLIMQTKILALVVLFVSVDFLEIIHILLCHNACFYQSIVNTVISIL